MAAPESRSIVELTTPVQFLKGCGQDRAELLARVGVLTVRDLVFYLPRDYQDLTQLKAIEQLEEGPPQIILGTVEEVDLRDRGLGRSILGVLVRQDAAHLRAVWFNQPYWLEKFRQGQKVLLAGKARMRSGRWEMVHPRVKWIDGDVTPESGELLPVYPLTAGLEQRQVRTLVRTALDACADQIDEVFPEAYLAEHDLLGIREALRSIHFPKDRESLELAQRRLVYQELFVLQLALALKRQLHHDSQAAIPLECTAQIDARIRRLFPFELTEGQNKAIREIAGDMGRTHPMNRLLQGDVGSGKTIVAVYAMLLAVAHKTQVVLMAPTEILARQHYETLSRLLAKSQAKLGLLVGGQTTKAREELRQGIATGEVQIVVGTQAVVASEIEFARLGLVVIDEQHKFGVRERLALRAAGVDPHYLVMTATPIPRTVAMTLFGDLDTSTLAESPPGRQNVYSYCPSPEDRGRWWEFFRKKLREGRQGYVVVPLVEGSDTVQTANLAETYEALANGELEAFRLGLVHGRMSSDEKLTAMAAFRTGQTQVLVATSVVEVGVDVPNATMLAVEGAERFGLSQLHQLRGRVSRGVFPGYCAVFPQTQSDESQARLAAFAASRDGFELAELDLAMRGPGELVGTRQHGLPPFRLADLARDAQIAETAREDARDLVQTDPSLSRPEHARLLRMTQIRYGKALELGDVG